MSVLRRLLRDALNVATRMIGRRPRFDGSREYWEHRYQDGGNSGVGSYGRFAEFKAEVLNDFVADHAVASVIEWGCGDGHQLALAEYPRYLGLDVSEAAIAACRDRFRDDVGKAFKRVSDYSGEQAELGLSLDVIYHLVEDDVYDTYMATLFESATRHVIIYSSNTDDTSMLQSPHVRHRKFSDWVARRAPRWRLSAHIPNRYPYRGDYRTGSFADFWIYVKLDSPEG